jgi:hypothetical protein
MEITEIFSLASNTLTAIAAIVVAIATLLGIHSWRREWKEKTRYETVHQVLVLTRKFRAAFRRSRGVFTWSSEYADRPRSEDETP